MPFWHCVSGKSNKTVLRLEQQRGSNRIPFCFIHKSKAPPERQETDFTILSLEFWARLLDKSTGANSQALFAKHYA
jgi:hypothetical protein